MAELKPCPFCGSTSVTAWHGFVQCHECHTNISGDTQGAIAAWNRRVVTPAQVEAAAKALTQQGSNYEPPRWIERAAWVLRAAGFEVEP